MTIEGLQVIPGDTRDLRDLAADDTGRVRVLPSAFWDHTTPAERALFGRNTGSYLFPTVELVAHLTDLIGGRTAIEIGAGNGVLAQALGIPATDNRMQEKMPWRDMFGDGPLKVGPAVPYGDNVQDLHASRAVRRHRPQVVIAAWVTHKFDRARQTSPGNPIGVDEDDILRHCEEYIFVGDEHVHRGKPIWKRPNTITYPDFVRSRSMNGSRQMIVTWPGIR